MCDFAKELGKNTDGDSTSLHTVLQRLLLGWHGQQYESGQLRACLQDWSSKDERGQTKYCLLRPHRYSHNGSVGGGLVRRSSIRLVVVNDLRVLVAVINLGDDMRYLERSVPISLWGSTSL